jgi:hypothetical protein
MEINLLSDGRELDRKAVARLTLLGVDVVVFCENDEMYYSGR